MTRVYALQRLLEHGDLSTGQIVAIGGVGWTAEQVRAAFRTLRRRKLVRCVGAVRGRERVWRLVQRDGVAP